MEALIILLFTTSLYVQQVTIVYLIRSMGLTLAVQSRLSKTYEDIQTYAHKEGKGKTAHNSIGSKGIELLIIK